MLRLAEHWQRFSELCRKEIWKPGQLKHRTPRAMLYAVLRVLSITWTVFSETKAASRAAALSFSSLLGLGPLVALTVLVAGFALDRQDPNLAANTLSRLIYFVAPQVAQYSKLPHHRDRQAKTEDSANDEAAATNEESNAASNTPAANNSPTPPTTSSPVPTDSASKIGRAHV